MSSSAIVLSTINARYIHSAFGLRYLKANLGELESSCEIQEFTLESRPEDIVESVLKAQPKIVGFGVYIWNIEQTTATVALLKAVAPEVVVVLGGPEVSYEFEGQRIIEIADYVITGWGEVSFSSLAHKLLNVNDSTNKAGLNTLGSLEVVTQSSSDNKIIKGEQAKLDQLKMPYYLYTEDDLRNRILYVEASRGCPFKCEFCLSALDKTAWPFELERFLDAMQSLYDRGARHFKFVDRTFNLKVKNSIKVLQFFLDRMDDDLFLHFEVIPDHLPEALKEMISKFPAGTLQFEIGIQTFNPEVQSLISRRQDNEKAAENIQWICGHSEAHVHADLIFGLPGESFDSFAESFDKLFELRPHEIQVGILKRLRGSPIIRHTQKYQLVFNPNPPFSILSSSTVDFPTVQFVNRFARYWDLIGNSGRFKHTLPILISDAPFANFSVIVNEIFARTGQTHKISLLRLLDLVFDIGNEVFKVAEPALLDAIKQDFDRSGLKSWPKCLRQNNRIESTAGGKKRHNQRQSRH